MSNLFRIMRRIEIDAAHRVPLHDSKCRGLHGHRYVIEAHCTGETASDGAETGMVLDFSFLKDGMVKRIHAPCDHQFIVQATDPLLMDLAPQVAKLVLAAPRDSAWCLSDTGLWHRGLCLYVVNDAPTAENLAHHWFLRLKPFVEERSEGRAALEKLRVYETPNCFADFPA